MEKLLPDASFDTGNPPSAVHIGNVAQALVRRPSAVHVDDDAQTILSCPSAMHVDNTALELVNVSHSYHTHQGETPALQNINLNVSLKEFVAIVGPSGCGKSTLLSLISGLSKPDSGTIRIASGGKVGYMFQRDNLFEWRTVYRNATLGLEIHGKIESPMPYFEKKSRHKKTQKNCTKQITQPAKSMPQKQIFKPAKSMPQKQLLPANDTHHNRTDELLKAYGLWDFRNMRPSQLSGGMRQRTALIRTLALEPDLLLLDEPFSALDYQTRLQVCDDVSSIIKNEGKTAILVTHDISEAISMADRIVVLSARPATIIDTVDIRFNKHFQTPFQRRNAPEFKDYFNRIWENLTSK